MNKIEELIYFLRIMKIDIKQFGRGSKNNPFKKDIVKIIKFIDNGLD